MKSTKDYYFYLIRNESEPNRIPATRNISASCTVVTPENEVKELRLARGASSIYVEKQGDIDGKRLIKPSFTKGVLIVKSHEKELLEYLRIHPDNRDSGHNPLNGAKKSTFFEYSPEDVAKKENEEFESTYEFMSKVMALDFHDVIKPMSMLAGLDYKGEKDEIVRKNFIDWCRTNKELFYTWLENEAYTERAKDVNEAIEQGILRVDFNKMFLHPDTELLSVPYGHQLVKEFIDWSYEDGAEQWKQIYKMLSKRTETAKKEVMPSEPVGSSLIDELDDLSSFLLVDRAKEEGVIKWSTPYYYFGDEKLGKGKDATCDMLDDDDKLRKSIILAIAG